MVKKPKPPPHVHITKNRTGRPFTYFQKYRGTARAEPRIRLPDFPSPEFWAEYGRIVKLPPPRSDTVTSLVDLWQASPEWAQMAMRTRGDWDRYCRILKDRWGDLRAADIQPKHVLALRDKYGTMPATANNLMRCLSSMLSWSVPRGWRPDNPCREIKPLRGGEGYEPWPWEVIEVCKAELRPDLWQAAALALYTGQRLGDVLRMRWDAINAAGLIAVRQGKTGKALLLPLHKDLRAVLDAIPRVDLGTILTSSEGRPWTESGFKSAWRKNKPAILKDRNLVFHGLRKSAVVTLLEAGATTAEVAAVTGQSMQMVEHYAKGVSQARLARSAMDRWEGNG